MVTFCLQVDSFCVLTGACWSRPFALPMGGPFGAQAADLHSLWCYHLHGQRFRELGTLRFTDAGSCLWNTANGRVLALAQFRDNIMVAAKGPGSTWAMRDITLFQVPRRVDRNMAVAAMSLHGDHQGTHITRHTPPPPLAQALPCLST